MKKRHLFRATSVVDWMILLNPPYFDDPWKPDNGTIPKCPCAEMTEQYQRQTNPSRSYWSQCFVRLLKAVHSLRIFWIDCPIAVLVRMSREEKWSVWVLMLFLCCRTAHVWRMMTLYSRLCMPYTFQGLTKLCPVAHSVHATGGELTIIRNLIHLADYQHQLPSCYR